MSSADAAASTPECARIDEMSWWPNARWTASACGSGDEAVATPRAAASCTAFASCSAPLPLARRCTATCSTSVVLPIGASIAATALLPPSALGCFPAYDIASPADLMLWVGYVRPGHVRWGRVRMRPAPDPAR